ncbi:hypothetical protein GCM10023321_57520 [Pseudonocardia eucalypti]|uniref:Uncharacterized protein n=1 Tax=Pseudonocardia eucalypti TaxID=648755 RepID=A0ABP9QRU5_9PSEU|nr:hypothetical protein [Pseudonocardia eucalypti]
MCSRGSGDDEVARLAELARVRAYREQAEIDGMAVSAAHWLEEEARLAAVPPRHPAWSTLTCGVDFSWLPGRRG